MTTGSAYRYKQACIADNTHIAILKKPVLNVAAHYPLQKELYNREAIVHIMNLIEDM